MSTLAGALIEAIGTKMETAFPGCAIIYGRPAVGGAFDVTDNTAFVHLMQESGKVGMGVPGVDTITPLIAVTVTRQLTTDAETKATAQSTQDLLADLRVAITNLVYDHVRGTATIPAFAGQALYITDYTMTPSFLTGVEQASKEAVTAEFTFRFSRPTGGR